MVKHGGTMSSFPTVAGAPAPAEFSWSATPRFWVAVSDQTSVIGGVQNRTESNSTNFEL